ncbi:MAG: hypothetical protein PHI91_03045 [Candidatus Pacebacteria bacterium]|nr:hypothetical protein [Candidatus Paceibacterota bacterium]MDD2757530.1 hypothetical protein [Candidatus Paceibacterota bacterium]MDD3283913.1 hypothetical protein [Candidatus Paceibacterota bacterium]MDD3970141.1 hypothetical protein [Candidatus Paceibacterota bacterium]MDD4738167.1 hypothetical protein [Candidatus Paceibacterota bacterium]
MIKVINDSKNFSNINDNINYKNEDSNFTSAEVSKTLEEQDRLMEKLRDESKKTQEEQDRIMEKLRDESKKTQNLVYIGFIAVLVVLVSTVLSAFYFIFQNQFGISYANEINFKYDSVLRTQQELINENQKIYTDINKNNITLDCFKHRGYFSYSCFDNR